MHVLIIGAGIGGLCTAIALQQAGITFTLYEKSPSLRASGAGISLWPNATRILRRFGILDQLLAQGEPIVQTQIQSAQGQILTGLDLTVFDEPTFCIQRSRLQTTLVNQIPEYAIYLGHTLTGIDQDETSVTARFENGIEVTGDLLIAADGIYSAARSLLWNAPAPKYQGYMAWRGTLKQPLSDWTNGLALQCWGRGQRLGLLSMGDNQMYWFASLNSATPKVNRASKKAHLTKCFQHWNSKVQEAIALTQDSEIMVRPIETAPKLKRWYHKRVLLLGDAAHAMTPNLGQGACMAIEDAATLAPLLARHHTLPQALAAYERHRKTRVNSVIRRSLLLGQVGQWDSPFLTTLRATGLKLAPEVLLQLSFQSLFRDSLCNI